MMSPVKIPIVYVVHRVKGERISLASQASLRKPRLARLPDKIEHAGDDAVEVELRGVDQDGIGGGDEGGGGAFAVPPVALFKLRLHLIERHLALSPALFQPA